MLCDTLYSKQNQCVCEAADSQGVSQPLQNWGLSPLVSSHGFICDRLYVRVDMCIQTRWTGETHRWHTSDNCLDSSGFGNYFPLEMNRAGRRVIAHDYHQTELSPGLATDQAELSARAKSLSLWSNRECLITSRWPQRLQMSECPVAAPPSLESLFQPPLCPNSQSKNRKKKIPEAPTFCIICLSIELPIAYVQSRRMMLMSFTYTNGLAC